MADLMDLFGTGMARDPEDLMKPEVPPGSGSFLPLRMMIPTHEPPMNAIPADQLLRWFLEQSATPVTEL